MEIDLSKGLPDHITMKHKNFHWTQTLDYENMAFRCRVSSTKHMSYGKEDPKKEKEAAKQAKRTAVDPPLSEDDEEENKDSTNTN